MSDPPLPSYSRSHPLVQEVLSLVQALLAKRAREQMDFSPGFYSHMFLASKKNNEWHAAIDVRALSRFRWGTQCTSIDLEDALLHLNSGMSRPAPPEFCSY